MGTLTRISVFKGTTKLIKCAKISDRRGFGCDRGGADVGGTQKLVP
jgi:hypothetical protein